MYIDPNTGGIMFQVLAAAVGVASGIILLFSTRIQTGIAAFRRFLRERIGKR
jgi:hypothetical protein